MPKITTYTPAWLSRPSPGYNLFSAQENTRTTEKASNGTTSKSTFPGPRRTIAHRGTELFVVVGNTIRWADLSTYKEEWEQKDQDRKRYSKSRGQLTNGDALRESDESSYRVSLLCAHGVYTANVALGRLLRFP